MIDFCYNIDMNEVILKLYKMFNEIFDKQINDYLNTAENNKKVPKESYIFLESAKKSINNCLSLIDNDEYIDALCLLRSSFEAIMFSVSITLDEKTYDMYKHYNSENYVKALKLKYKKMQQKNPKFKIPDLEKEKKNFLTPYNIRKTVANNYKVLFGNLFIGCQNEKEVLLELNDFYRYLCDFTHPSIVKTYVFKIQNDINNLNGIRTIFRLNIHFCRMLLLLTLNYISGRDIIEEEYDLYAIICLLDISLDDNYGNVNSLLKKYNDYLYLSTTRKYLNRNNNKKLINELISEIKQIDNVDEFNLNLNLNKCIKSIILKFDVLDIYNKYFEQSL